MIDLSRRAENSSRGVGPREFLGSRQVVKAPDFDSGMRRVRILPPQPYRDGSNSDDSGGGRESWRTKADGFTGNANPCWPLGGAPAEHPRSDTPPSATSDGETMAEILETRARQDCFVLQSTCSPANDHPHGGAVDGRCAQALVGGPRHRGIPYFGYARRIAGRARRGSHQREGCSQHAAGIVCGSCAHHGSACDQIQGFSTCR